ncbi:hypothetical protein OCEANICA350_20033 [Oceanicaulis sp. 350]|nr:hypothetical protein OCEANICA350_20033 [Oceanicaulis sp. 350]
MKRLHTLLIRILREACIDLLFRFLIVVFSIMVSYRSFQQSGLQSVDLIKDIRSLFKSFYVNAVYRLNVIA